MTISESSDNKNKYYLKVDQYINTYGAWLNQNVYYLKETERITSTFRHMHSVSSTYDYSYSNGENHQGLNYINLLKENNRWYISNLKWNQKTSDLNSWNEFLSDKED